MNLPETPQTLSVSQLNRLARQLLEDCFASVSVTGELSTLSRPSSGHWYFTLKDAGAQIRCAFFRNRNMGVGFKPEPGQQVTLRGRVSLYEGRGDYQLIVDSMQPAGAGALAAAFEALKQELQSAGWFAPERKKPLPTPINHLAVITSPTGAAIQDIRAVLERRWPAMRITVLPVLVQGEQAARQIQQALEAANRLYRSGEQDFDVVLLSRGGGSLEDLWPFNERIVAEAIYQSALPVVSAVGHEVDFSISDFVADVRAPTPSAAAELLSPDQSEILSRLHLLAGRLTAATQRRLSRSRQQLEQLSQRIRDPRGQLQTQAQRLDELEMRLKQQLQRDMHRRIQRLDHLNQRFSLLNPTRRLKEDGLAIALLQQRLQQSWRPAQQQRRQQVAHLQSQLSALGPQQTLNRGYSILLDKKGHVIKSTAQLSAGEQVEARLADGQATLEVSK